MGSSDDSGCSGGPHDEERAPYADLAAMVERGLVAVDSDREYERVRTFEHLRHTFTVNLAGWDRMLEQLLELLAEDAGSVGRGLSLLGVPTTSMIAAWVRGPTAGMQSSVRWMASQPRDVSPDIRLRVVKIKRGEDYADLAESARTFRLRGDGQLDAARLRPQYTVALRRSWLRMVGDLLGQVVADAGSRERAATVLGVDQRSLMRWLRWFVSRGSLPAVRLDWPLASVDEIDATRPYADLAAAWLRGSVAESSGEETEILPVNELQEFYRVRLGPWDEMVGSLLRQISLDAGSVRNAARTIGIPRSTLSAKIRRYRERQAKQEVLSQ